MQTSFLFLSNNKLEKHRHRIMNFQTYQYSKNSSHPTSKTLHDAIHVSMSSSTQSHIKSTSFQYMFYFYRYFFENLKRDSAKINEEFRPPDHSHCIKCAKLSQETAANLNRPRIRNQALTAIEISFTDYMNSYLFFPKESMQNLLYFNPALFSSCPYPVNYVLPSPLTGNYLYLPCLPTHAIPTQEAYRPQLSLIDPLPMEKLHESGLSVEQSLKTTPLSVRGEKERRQLRTTREEEEQFHVKPNKNGTNVLYKKKNTESNIVNQTFSHLNSERSRHWVLQFFKNDGEKADQFYRLMGKVKQANKKYINRKYLRRLIAFAPTSEFCRIFHKSKISYITVEEVRKLIKIITYHFLREQVYITLLTSSKIYKETLPEHFWRKRQILDFLFSPQRVSSQ